MSLKQRTFKVKGKMITIKSRPKTYVGNLVGWYVYIRCQPDNTLYDRYFKNCLTREEAENKAYSKWIKEKNF